MIEFVVATLAIIAGGVLVYLVWKFKKEGS
jgi:hypothetical protein